MASIRLSIALAPKFPPLLASCKEDDPAEDADGCCGKSCGGAWARSCRANFSCSRSRARWLRLSRRRFSESSSCPAQSARSVSWTSFLSTSSTFDWRSLSCPSSTCIRERLCAGRQEAGTCCELTEASMRDESYAIRMGRSSRGHSDRSVEQLKKLDDDDRWIDWVGTSSRWLSSCFARSRMSSRCATALARCASSCSARLRSLHVQHAQAQALVSDSTRSTADHSVCAGTRNDIA